MNVDKIAIVAEKELGHSELGDWYLPEPGGLIGVLRAYSYAYSYKDRMPREEDLRYMINMIVPAINTYRVTSLGDEQAANPKEISELIHYLFGYILSDGTLTASPGEFAQALVDIKPFAMGNETLGWIIYNWVAGTLDDPEPLPELELFQGEGYIHSKDICVAPCPFHAPSNHHMRDWKIVIRSDIGTVERQCEHGIGHPDPDSIKYLRKKYKQDGYGVHSCDGCCVRQRKGRIPVSFRIEPELIPSLKAKAHEQNKTVSELLREKALEIINGS